jgi:hypothetical protein
MLSQYAFSVVAVVAATLSLGLGGCNQAKGLEDRFVAAPPDESELVGLWRPDKSSLSRLAAEGFERTQSNDHFIALKNDHSCVFSSYWFYGWDHDPLIATDACTWQISTEQVHIHHFFARDVAVVDIVLRQDGGWTHATYYVVREDGKIVLWDFIGDPDYSTYMDFLRVGEGSAS